jgi:ubiquinone/menaquinone biosynthesis C-methylase UbiE
MKYNSKKNWTKCYEDYNSISYPAEAVIRIFKGKFPNLNFKFKKNEKILDIGFGDGRHLKFFSQIGLDCYGVELSKKIINIYNLLDNSVQKEKLKVGDSSKTNFKDNFFNYVLSWNVIYYMQGNKNINFEDHVKELDRILLKKGKIIISIPKKTCFIYKGSCSFRPGYRIIKNDYFNTRNGQIMRYFSSEKEIQRAFEKYFCNFIFSTIQIEWFGLNYHWHVFIAEKK